jgi:hypothetical protein
MNLTTVKAVWDALVAEHGNRSQTSIIDLDHQMTFLRCREDDNACDHIYQLVCMREKLASMGKTISNCKFSQGIGINASVV